LLAGFPVFVVLAVDLLLHTPSAPSSSRFYARHAPDALAIDIAILRLRK
jgi:hypothetical protein